MCVRAVTSLWNAPVELSIHRMVANWVVRETAHHQQQSIDRVWYIACIVVHRCSADLEVKRVNCFQMINQS
jgi:hypothetical protein